MINNIMIFLHLTDRLGIREYRLVSYQRLQSSHQATSIAEIRQSAISLRNAASLYLRIEIDTADDTRQIAGMSHLIL